MKDCKRLASMFCWRIGNIAQRRAVLGRITVEAKHYTGEAEGLKDRLRNPFWKTVPDQKSPFSKLEI